MKEYVSRMSLKVSVTRFLKVTVSYLIALARLVVWTIIFFFSGLQRTLFMKSEVVRVDFVLSPLRCDMEDMDDKLAYIDKLCTENPDLAEAANNLDDEDIYFDDEEG